MTVSTIAAGAALLLAVVALVRARLLERRLEALSESYWQLRYEHGQLAAQVKRLENNGQSDAEAVPAPRVSTAFVPLSSLKR